MLAVSLYLLALPMISFARPHDITKAPGVFPRQVTAKQCPGKGGSGDETHGRRPHHHWENSSVVSAQPYADPVITISSISFHQSTPVDTVDGNTKNVNPGPTQMQTQQTQAITEIKSAPHPSQSSVDSGSDNTGTQIDDSNTKGKISTTDPKELLKLHNEYRSTHGAGPLTWNSTMQDYAAKYALQCTFQHS
jgi:hypothetical protein